MPTSQDPDVPDDAQHRGSDPTDRRSGGASFAALYSRQSRLSGLRLLRPGRRAVIPAVAFLLLAALIGGIATLTSHFSSSGGKDVAASRPAAASTGALPNGASSTPAAGGGATATHQGAPQKPSPTRPAVPGGKSAGQNVPGAPAVPPAGSAGGGTAGSASGTSGSSTTGGTSGGGTGTTGSTGTTAPTHTSTSTAGTTSGPFHITGQLLCESGHAVVGVWVQTANPADSRYAAWKGVGDGSTADWWTDLPKDESYHLNVGCGGTPSSWGTSNQTGNYSGGHNSFNCDDVSGDPNYEKCTHR
jgi:hypothetical protein